MTTLTFAILPSFGHLAFSDSATVEEALQYVLQARNKTDGGDSLLGKIKELTGSVTVGDLRRLTDPDWNKMDVPAMCRIYLKCVVRQSGRTGTPTSSTPKSSTFMEELQNDFNYGQAFDLSLYTSSLQQLASMGFKQEEAMEALCITENKSVESALEVLFVGKENVKKRKRVEAVAKLGRTANRRGSQSSPPPSASPASNSEATNSGPSSSSSSSSSSESMAKELVNMRMQMDQEKKIRQKLELDLKTQQGAVGRTVYKEFLRGMITDPSTGNAEFDQLKLFARKKQISDSEHVKILGELNYSKQQFDDLKKSGDSKADSKDCVVCLDKPKDHIILNCMHLCLCEECGPQYANKRNAKCPMCSKRVVEIRRVYL
jgi:hypothetical protein